MNHLCMDPMQFLDPLTREEPHAVCLQRKPETLTDRKKTFVWLCPFFHNALFVRMFRALVARVGLGVAGQPGAVQKAAALTR